MPDDWIRFDFSLLKVSEETTMDMMGWIDERSNNNNNNLYTHTPTPMNLINNNLDG